MQNVCMEQTPAVFLSSTFFGLRQIRAGLGDFIESQLGYRLVASEYSSFPVDPAFDAVENCRRRVENDVDLFVLIIGTRYGSIPAGLKCSVTNAEYLSARAAGVPIFAFVHRDVLALLPLWTANPATDFSSQVDNPRLFEFVTQLRHEDGVWSFPFDTTQDIVKALRLQFAYQYRRGLNLTRRMAGDGGSVRTLQGAALRIALERPKAWQALLTAELLEDKISLEGIRKRDYLTGFAGTTGEQIAWTNFANWISVRAGESCRILEQLNVTLNDTLNSACNGSDVDAIIYAAGRLAAGYRDALEWSLRVRAVHVVDELRPAVDIFARFFEPMFLQLEEFPRNIRDGVTEMCSSGAERTRITLTMAVDELLLTAFHDEMKRATGVILQRMDS